jgi:hypothetical protein
MGRHGRRGGLDANQDLSDDCLMGWLWQHRAQSMRAPTAGPGAVGGFPAARHEADGLEDSFRPWRTLADLCLTADLVAAPPPIATHADR